MLPLLAVLFGIGSLSPSKETVSEDRDANATAASASPIPMPTAAVATRAPRSTHSITPQPATTAPTKRTDRDAQAALAELPVKGRAPKSGYSREQFGDDWATVGGCDTRDRMLTRDLTEKTYAPRDPCEVQSGRLSDPYTATAITFVIGDASEVDIDHVVALSDASQKGAQQWPHSRRVRLANDPLNLLSVAASANRQKGAGDAATWLPPNKRFRCECCAPGRGQAEVQSVDDAGRARRHSAGAREVPRAATASLGACAGPGRTHSQSSDRNPVAHPDGRAPIC